MTLRNGRLCSNRQSDSVWEELPQPRYDGVGCRLVQRGHCQVLKLSFLFLSLGVLFLLMESVLSDLYLCFVDQSSRQRLLIQSCYLLTRARTHHVYNDSE